MAFYFDLAISANGLNGDVRHNGPTVSSELKNNPYFTLFKSQVQMQEFQPKLWDKTIF